MRRLLHLLLIGIFIASKLYAQSPSPDTSRPAAARDSTITPFVQKVLEAAARDKHKSEAIYEAGKVRMKQRMIWDALTRTADNVKLYLVNGVNLKNAAAELVAVKASFAVVQDGIFIHKGTAQTDRNLSISSVILFQLIKETEDLKKKTDNFTFDLVGYRNRIDSLLSDPIIYIFPHDSVALVQYLNRLRVVATQGNPSDNALNETLESAQLLQNDIDRQLFSMKSAYENIEQYRNKLEGANLGKEFAEIWNAPEHYRPFSEIARFSLAKEKMALAFYVRENMLKLVFLLLLVALACWWVYSLKKKLVADGQPHEEPDRKLLLQYPIAASLLVVLSIYQFVFINAPFIFSFCIWSICVASLLVMLRNFITPFWNRFWIVLAALFLLACLDNFLLQASRHERWIMLALALAGILYGSYIIASKHRRELKESSIILFIKFLVVMEALALLLNVFGRYNLSKTLLISGYTGTVNAILFLWVVRLINEGMALGAALYRRPDRRLFYINFNRLGNKAPAMLYTLLVAGWIVIVGRNFYVFKRVAIAFSGFLHKERTLGDYNFSINGLALFLLIMTCALLLSRIVSFFAADPQATHSNTSSKRIAAGSWILLIRIFIVSLGLFLSFAAAGLPLDKITIVLGALSVGIGLGLQGLVSNLISGLIIAFEKPVSVGDLIEVDGKSGIMKSIGFRSSVVSLGDGSSLVVPNGDLLNRHVVNWSSARNMKRVIIHLGVAYGSDLKQVKAILEDIANADERVLRSPASLAIPRNFGDSAINLDLIVWVKGQREAEAVTGSLIMAIDQTFREKGISIPFPQQDIHVYKTKDTPDKAGESS